MGAVVVGTASSGKERMGLRTSLGMALNLLLLLAMVATNLLSLYHLTATTTTTSPLPPPQNQPLAHIPDHLITQLATIRSSISHLTRLQSQSSSNNKKKLTLSPELLLVSKLSPIGTACYHNADLLHQYMNYTPFLPCPPLHPPDLLESLLLRGCHPLPRRRCFSRSPTHYSLSPSSLSLPPPPPPSNLHLALPDLLRLAKGSSALPIRLAIDVGGGNGTFAARMKLEANATVLTTTMNLGFPHNEAAALRGVVPLHVPLQQRLPVHDGAMDLVRCGHAVNRWIPTSALEFLLFDVDRVLRSGGLLWLDHFFCKGGDLEKVYTPVIRKLGYKILKWTTGNKTDASGVKNGDVYLTALLQKHPPPK